VITATARFVYTERTTFAEVSKNLARYKSENHFIELKNNYVGRLN